MLTFYVEQNISSFWQLCEDVSSVTHFWSPKNRIVLRGEPYHPAEKGYLETVQVKLHMDGSLFTCRLPVIFYQCSQSKKLSLKLNIYLYQNLADNIKNINSVVIEFQCKRQAIELTIYPTEKAHPKNKVQPLRSSQGKHVNRKALWWFCVRPLNLTHFSFFLRH